MALRTTCPCCAPLQRHVSKERPHAPHHALTPCSTFTAASAQSVFKTWICRSIEAGFVAVVQGVVARISFGHAGHSRPQQPGVNGRVGFPERRCRRCDRSSRYRVLACFLPGRHDRQNTRGQIRCTVSRGLSRPRRPGLRDDTPCVRRGNADGCVGFGCNGRRLEHPRRQIDGHQQQTAKQQRGLRPGQSGARAGCAGFEDVRYALHQLAALVGNSDQRGA